MLSSCSQLMQASAGSVTHEMETAYTKVHQPEDDQQEYFSKDASHQTKLFYYTSALLLVVYTVIALGAPLLSLPCHLEPTTRQYANPDYVPDPCRWTRYAILGGLTKWECEVMHSLARPILPQTSHPILPISHRMLLSRNDPLSRTAHPSPDVTPHSSYISPDASFPECEMCVRVLVSILCGSIIGFERRRADRPAGIRTMSMVTLGRCLPPYPPLPSPTPP